jgi:hypothetical protein
MTGFEIIISKTIPWTKKVVLHQSGFSLNPVSLLAVDRVKA